jgi:hypothetical protein
MHRGLGFIVGAIVAFLGHVIHRGSAVARRW